MKTQVSADDTLNNRQQESSALFVISGFIVAVLISIPQH